MAADRAGPASGGTGAGLEGGFALLIVLWSVILLALIGTRIVSAGRQETRLAANLRQAAILEAAADGAIATATFHLLDRSDGHWPANGAPREVPAPGAMVELRIDNQAGLVNPNLAPPFLLGGLLRGVGVGARDAAAIADAMVAWRAPREPGLEPLRLLRLNEYRAAGLADGPAGGPFETLDELGLVQGMTPDILARLAPHLSLFVGDQADRRAADPVVRAALLSLPGGGAAPTPDPLDLIRLGAARVLAPSSAIPEDVVTITAAASGAGAARFVRRAVVRVAGQTGPSGFKILSWESPEP